jgi:hypothetical protein
MFGMGVLYLFSSSVFCMTQLQGKLAIKVTPR